MCRAILVNVTRTNDQRLVLYTDIGNLQLSMILQYCQNKTYSKTTSSISFPLPQNELSENPGIKSQDLELIKDVIEDFH
jgi:hypothetical protein